MKMPWTQRKSANECADVSRMSKKSKVRPEDIRIKAEVRQTCGTHNENNRR